MQSGELWSGKKIILLEQTASCTLRIAVTVYCSLPLVTCIHMSYVKSLLSILVERLYQRKKSGELHPATFPDTMQTTQ